MAKVKLFTHGQDLDGGSCDIIAKITFGEDNVDTTFVDYSDVNEVVTEFLTTEDVIVSYNYIFITDISVNEETAKLIQGFHDHGLRILLLDHHDTPWLTRYPWATIVDERDGQKESGASLFYEYATRFNDEINFCLADFVEQVRLWDTFTWDKLGLTRPKDVNTVYRMVGRDTFIEVYTEFIAEHPTKDFEFTPIHQAVLYYKNQENEEYIVSKMKQVQIINRVAYVVADNFACKCEVGNRICKTMDCDYAAIITGSGVSLRSVGDFDVSKIAKLHGGGGRTNTAGFKFDSTSHVAKALWVIQAIAEVKEDE